jgi:hypothetical protein
MIVTLTPQEAMTAGHVGLYRQCFAMTKKLPHFGTPTSDQDDLAFDHHIVSAWGEFIVAKTLNLFWAPNVGNIRGIDVGGVVEVRVRKVPGTGVDLAIREHDKDGRPYVLAHHLRGGFSFELVGWLYGHEAKGRGPFNELRKVWFVPPPYRPIDELLSLYTMPTSQEKTA